jgi:ParB family chromosome partitioning protein
MLPDGAGAVASDADDGEDDVAKPLPERLVGELTAHRTLALRNALAGSPETAFIAVLHALVLSVFHFASRESCLGISVDRATFPHQAPGLKDSNSAQAVAARHDAWKERLPKSDRDLWEALVDFDGPDQAALFAHCASYAVNAIWEAAPRYDNGRISAHGVQRRLEHSHVLARAVGLDMVAAGWRPTVDDYLGRVTKRRILDAVSEAKGTDTAGLIDHLKKGDMAREAARLLEDSGWLPEPLRTPAVEQPIETEAARVVEDAETLPAFLSRRDDAATPAGDGPDDYAIAAE